MVADAAALISVVDSFARVADCRRMLEESARGVWVRSEVEGPADLAAGASGRTSESLMLPGGFGAWARNWLGRVEVRLGALLSLDSSCLEPWQMTRYRRGGAYDYHLDCGAWSRHPSGERARTVMLVLEQPKRGGATHFRALARTFEPLVGRLIVWRNLLPGGECNHSMIHSGRPVWQGRKTILITWERQRRFVDGNKGEASGY